MTEKETTYWQIRQESWQDSTEFSDYRAMLKIQEMVQKKDFENAQKLISEYIEDMEAFQKYQIWDALKDLMYWRLRWEAEPEVRTGETALEVFKLMDEFGIIFYDNVNLGKEYVESIWDETFESAFDRAKLFTKNLLEKLTWEDIFDFEYKTF